MWELQCLQKFQDLFFVSGINDAISEQIRLIGNCSNNGQTLSSLWSQLHFDRIVQRGPDSSLLLPKIYTCLINVDHKPIRHQMTKNLFDENLLL